MGVEDEILAETGGSIERDDAKVEDASSPAEQQKTPTCRRSCRRRGDDGLSPDDAAIVVYS